MTEQKQEMRTAGERPLSALDAIFVRRSTRSYAADPIDEATVRALLDAAVQAPTAMHQEPWVFAIVQNRTTLKRISDRAKGHWSQDAASFGELHGRIEGELATAFASRFASPDFSVFYDAGTLIAIGAKPGPFVAADCWLAAQT